MAKLFESVENERFGSSCPICCLLLAMLGPVVTRMKWIKTTLLGKNCNASGKMRSARAFIGTTRQHRWRTVGAKEHHAIAKTFMARSCTLQRRGSMLRAFACFYVC